MVVFSLFVVNKAGGLIYNTDFSSSVTKRDGNMYLRLASTFHSMHAISTQLSPVRGCTGISSVEADTFKLACYQTPTGTKFFVTAEKRASNLDAFLLAVYEIFSDYVLKNPFYELEMPIRSELWDYQLSQFAKSF